MTVRQPKNGTHYTAIDTPPKVLLGPFEKSRTRQSEAAATDINTIMKRYERTRMLPQTQQRDVLYADVSEMPDYRTSLDMIRSADTLFMDLPADLRSKFDNDPAVFLDWTSDPDNRDEMIALGMLAKPEEDEPPKPPAPEEGIEPPKPPAPKEGGDPEPKP